jgi:xanthine phosphoribosyltransferase
MGVGWYFVHIAVLSQSNNFAILLLLLTIRYKRGNSLSVYQQDKFVSWDEVQFLCRALAERIHTQHPNIKKILAITRGGLFPAGILARELNIKHIETVGLESYTEKERGQINLLKPFSPDFSEDVLLVDDLADTGNTLNYLQKSLKSPVTVTLYVKPMGRHLVHFYAEEVPQTTWIRFPWDTARTYTPPLVQE